jgi:hypothetical protein
MTTRTSSKTVIFDNPFSLKSVDQMVPAATIEWTPMKNFWKACPS